MRSEGTRSRSALFCRVVVVVSFIGIGWSLIGHGPFGTRNSKFETRNSSFEIRNSKLGNREWASGRNAQGDAATRAPVIRAFETRPLTFEANRGQTDGRVKFLSRGGGYALFLTGDEAVLTLEKPSQMANVEKPGARSQESGVDSRLRGNDKQRTTGNERRTTGAVVGMRLLNADQSATVIGVDELAGKSNYFIGNDPAEWHTNVPNYARVKYESIYPGVDLVFYGNQRQLEYDFVVEPGADPGVIRLAVDEENQKSEIRNQKSTQFKIQNAKCKIDASGDLVIPTGSGEVVFHKPVVYQEQSTVDSRELKVGRRQSAIENRQFLEGHYVLAADGSVGFEIPNYDKSKRLVIDPALSYSSYLGGSNNDNGNAIAVDSNSNAYVVGQTFSSDFPLVAPYQPTCKSCASSNGTAFVTEINASGGLVYSTFLGGNSTDSATAVAVDSAGDAFVVGSTTSAGFPRTAGAFQIACSSCGAGQPDAFVTELNPAGSGLVFSTFLGGSQSDQATGVAVDSTGVYVTGTTSSNDFPTQNPLQPKCGGPGGTGCASASDAFVTKISAGGATLMYSTFLGGSGTDAGHAIAVDSNGNAYVTGVTQSNDFPTFSAYRNFINNSSHNAFVTALNSTGTQFVYSTYLGGQGTGHDEGNGIAVDSSGNAFVTGFTTSSDFPTVNPLIGKLRGSQSAFITMVDHTGSTLDFSTYIGGTASDTGTAIALDSSANCYITGNTSSSDFPTVNVIQGSGTSTLVGSQAAFVTKINPNNPVFISSSYLGGHGTTSGSGIAVDSNRNAYVTGQTSSKDFPTASPFQSGLGGSSDAFVSAVNGLMLPLLNVSPRSLSFPDTAVGSTSAPLAVLVSNAGDATLHFTSPITTTTSTSTTSEFSETDNCGGSLAPAATCTVNVTFSPVASGTQSGTLKFTDDAAFSPQQMTLSGNGTQPTIQFSPTSLAFGNQGITATSPAQNVTVTNSGTAPLVIQSIVATPSDYAVSANGTTCPISPSSLSAGSNCVISVTFTPSASNSIPGALAITDNAPGSPQALTLSGTGVVAFGLSAPNGQSQTINRGTNTATFLIQAGSPFNFTGPITLACHGTGLVTCSFNPTSITAGQQSTLTLSNFTSLPSDTLNFSVTGTNGNQVFQLSLQVLIPDFGLAVSPTTETVNAGQTASYTLSFVPLNNFTDPVTFTCLGVPASITCTVNPSSVTSDGTSTLTPLLTLGTTARASAGPHIGPKVIMPPLGQPARPHWLLWLLAFFMITTLAAAQRRRARPDRVGARLGFALTALFVLLWAACTVSTNTSSGTPAGDYGIVVEGATNGSTVKHDVALRLIVN